MNRTLKFVLVAGTALSITVSTFSQTPPAPAGVDPATHAAHLKQDPASHAASAQPGAAGDANADLVNQIAALRAEVAKLQAALALRHTAQAPAAVGGMGMAGRGKMQQPMGSGQMQPMQAQPMSGSGSMAPMPAAPAGGGMGMMDDDMMEMGGMSGGGGGMGMMDMDGMMKMMGMGNMPMGGAGNPAAMAMPSALPGFPGASHIYHVGATGLFLDHPEHITLTLDQQTALNQRKERTLLQQAEFQRKIEQAEQELWVLTAADQPDAAAIDKKVQEIAKFQGDQRVAFIRAVGEAAQLLTDEQRKQLTGMLPPAPTPMAPAAPAMPGMPAGGGMSDM